MGNRRARELMLQQEEDACWQRIRTEPRPATRDVHARGIGALRVQLIKCPSFEEARAWEVRNGPQGWTLFEPRVLRQLSILEVELVGYDAVPFPSDRLATFFAKITALSLPIAPILTGSAGADGTLYQMAVFGDLCSSWRFHWWDRPPEGWRPLVTIAEEMFAAFESTK